MDPRNLCGARRESHPHPRPRSRARYPSRRRRLLTIPRPCGHWTDNNGDRVDVTHWTRIRWETLPHTDIQDLETAQ